MCTSRPRTKSQALSSVPLCSSLLYRPLATRLPPRLPFLSLEPEEDASVPFPLHPPLPPLFFLLKSDALFFFQVPGGPFSESQGWIVPMGDDLNTTEYHPHCLRRGAFSHSFTHAFAQMLTPFSSLRLHFQRHPDGSQPDRAFSLLMETLPIPDAPSRFDASGSRCASTSLTTDPFTGAARARSTPGPTCTAGVFLPPLLFSRCLTDEHSCLAAVATPPSAEVRLLSSSW